MSNILVADDNMELCNALKSTLEKVGHCVELAYDGNEAIKRLMSKSFDLLLADLRIPEKDGMEILKASREHSQTTVIIMMTAYGTIENAVEAMRLGASDYVIKPFSLDEIEIKVRRVIEGQRMNLENEFLKEKLSERFGPIIGSCEKMQQIYSLIAKVASTSAPVLITGQSGTGKELVAREIHNRSERSRKPFVTVNCVTLASNLLESELFGHEKGSFTGAVSRHLGKLQIADNGTLFLDEICESSDSVQVKLLRFLQEKELERVGGNETIRVDVRVIAASNRDLQQRIKEGRFREDLFYRLNMVSITLPPLRERGDDIVELARYFVNKYNLEFGKSVEISPEVMGILKQHSWPGNVRELENVIGQAVILAEGKYVELKHLPYSVAGSLIEHAIFLGEGESLIDRMDAIESEIIRIALEENNWNQSQAAKSLGIKRSSLQYKVEKYGLMPGNRTAKPSA
ncbi:MAG: sigma-54 dependent transcriptional regulator [bacterium]